MKAFLGKLFSQCYSVKRPAFEFLSLLKIAIESPFSFCESNLWKAFSLYWSLVLKISAKVCFSLKIFFCSVKVQSLLTWQSARESTEGSHQPVVLWLAPKGQSIFSLISKSDEKQEWCETVVLIFTKRSTENRDIQPPCLKCLQLVFLLFIT